MKRIKLLAFLVILSSLSYLGVYLFEVKNNPVTDITVAGKIDYADGIGRQSIDLLAMLVERKDFLINFIPIQKIFSQDVPENILEKVNNKGTDRSIGKVLIYEGVFKVHKNEVRTKLLFSEILSWLKSFPRAKQIWYTYSMYESTAIHEDWVNKINNYFDAVIVPDDFLVEVYKSSGVKKPIFVIPLPVDLDSMLQQPLKTSKNDIFTFTNLSAISSRKNQLQLVQAFHKAFKDSKKVRLVINGRFKKDEYFSLIKRYIRENDIRNIEINLKRLSKQDYLKFMQKSDCYVNISKGEGFSIQPREAMALGIPVIISDNTAQKTIVKSGLTIPVSSNKTQAAYNEFLKLTIGNEFLVDTDEIANAMLEVYNNYDHYLEKSPAMREWAKQYQRDNLKAFYQTIVKPKRVVIGNKNDITENYIITDSKELYNKYKFIKSLH